MKKFASALISFPSVGVDSVYPATPVPIGSKPSGSFSPNPALAKAGGRDGCVAVNGLNETASTERGGYNGSISGTHTS